MHSRDSVSLLSDDELRHQLETFGVRVGMISSTTRALYQKQLIKQLSQTSDAADGGEKSTESQLANDYNKPELVIQPQTLDADVYYGVHIPKEIRDTDAVDGIVHVDTANCIATMKKYPGSRFKGFSKYDDALDFSFNGPSTCKSSSSNGAFVESEKQSPFRGPKSQDLILFRKAIEKGKLETVCELINSNPRYIVSSADTPTILQEGSRYNAIHVTCRSNQPEICAKILGIVANPLLFQRLYPEEDVENAIRRSRHLLDLYLNTPDKGINETPLHFACKNGFVECVQVLLSYVDCDKQRSNKYDETPQQIICSRAKGKFSSSKMQIESLFEEQYYVPVCRDEENCLAPTVGSPFSLTSDQSPISQASSPSSFNSSFPISPLYKVKGFGGPMSPQKAEVFYNRLKRSSVPSSSPKGKVASIRIADHEKGLERVGRNLAADLNIHWKEYWEFLGEFVNLSSPEGLRKLEAHLQTKYREVIEERNTQISSDCLERLGNTDTSESSLNDKREQLDLSEVSMASNSTTAEICTAFEALRLNVSLSPNSEYMKYRPTSGATFNSDSPPALNNNEPLYDSKLDDSTFSIGKGAASFYNYSLRSAQIASQKVSDLLLDLSENLQHQSASDYSIMKSFLRCDLFPEVVSFRKVIKSSFHISDLKAFDTAFLHLVLAAESLQKLMKDLPLYSLFELRLAFQSYSTTRALQYFAIEDDDDLFECVSQEEKNDRIAHLNCVVTRLKQCLSIVIDSPKAQENEKVDLNLLDKCECDWASVCDVKATPSSFRSRPVDVNFIRSSERRRSARGGSSRIRRVSSWLHRFLFGEEEEQSDACQAEMVFRNPLVRHLSFEDEVEGTPPIDYDQVSNADSFATAASSFDEGERHMVTPEERINFYIDGTLPSKVDIDVLNAIQEVDIDAILYPRIAEWSSLISSTPLETKNSWASPCCRRGKPVVWNGDVPSLYGSLDESFTSDQLRRSIFSKSNPPFTP